MSLKKKNAAFGNVRIGVSLKDILRWQRERSRYKKDLSFVVPHSETKALEFINTNRKEFSLTFIGHATFLIQINGLNILTDPVWANTMGIEKRLAAPGIKLSDLPDIDIVLISHNHYDHLNFASLFKLRGDPIHLVPKGLRALFKKKGLHKTEEFLWWDKKIVSDCIDFTFVPAQHWSRRTIWDTNNSLWGGWVIKQSRDGSVENFPTVYFVGDSGYFNGFKEIGEKFDINYMLAPIGCYEPEWFRYYQHMTPEEAIKAHCDCASDILIPMHYDAYRLGVDTPKEALDRLKAGWCNKKLTASNIKILKLGETLQRSTSTK